MFCVIWCTIFSGGTIIYFNNLTETSTDSLSSDTLSNTSSGTSEEQCEREKNDSDVDLKTHLYNLDDTSKVRTLIKNMSLLDRYSYDNSIKYPIYDDECVNNKNNYCYFMKYNGKCDLSDDFCDTICNNPWPSKTNIKGSRRLMIPDDDYSIDFEKSCVFGDKQACYSNNADDYNSKNFCSSDVLTGEQDCACPIDPTKGLTGIQDLVQYDQLTNTATTQCIQTDTFYNYYDKVDLIDQWADSKNCIEDTNGSCKFYCRPNEGDLKKHGFGVNIQSKDIGGKKVYDVSDVGTI
tara:strand:- start:220 stop:1098 length:879 start_codon:yes stop_codon:yes gene_type:complete